jgi:glycosyltransferase involved in cell wall biosynthesis
MSVSISAVLIVRNEERNLPYALRSVLPWADEVLVVDMHSEDRTRELAETFGARVLLHEVTGFVEPARAFALERCQGTWVLLLDADGLVPAPLSRRLRAIADGDEADAVVIPRANFLLGRRLGHSGWGPHQDVQLRFFRRGTVRVTDRIHEKPAPTPGARVLKLPPTPEHSLVHFNYVDLAHFLEKLDRYTTIEADQAHARGESLGLGTCVVRPVRRFLGKYVRQQGWRDGWRGFVLAVYQAFYEFAAGTKRIERRRVGSADEIDAGYRDEAERILRAYDEDAASPDGGARPASHLDSESPRSSQSM